MYVLLTYLPNYLHHDANMLNLDDNDAASAEDLFQSADNKLFRKILRNSAHVLQPLIPDCQPSSYDLRPRSHDKLLLNKTTYRDSCWCVYHCKLGLCPILFTSSLTISFISCVCQLFFLKNKMNEWMNEWNNQRLTNDPSCYRHESDAWCWILESTYTVCCELCDTQAKHAWFSRQPALQSRRQ